MKQTNQFQLNLIEPTDKFEVAPINENTQTLEDALIAHGQAADAHGDIRNALSGHTNSKSNPHGVTAAQVGAAAQSHTHSAANITSGTLSVERGGTGNTSVDTAPTASSTKMVTSGGVYTALSKKADSEHTHNYAAASHTHSGYAAASHTHSDYAAADHTHSTYYNSSTSRTANTVLAAPDGKAGAATFRKLAAADIPSLPVSKLTSGTLSVERGGTGNTSVDTTPTANSTKMVTSGGVYTALAGKANSSHTHDYAASNHTHSAYAAASHTHDYAASSHNHSAGNITSGTLPVARGGTGNTSVDTTPTSGSTKMVTSGGVYTALQKKFGTDALPWVIGTYTGNGSTTTRFEISLGFRPSAVFVVREPTDTNEMLVAYGMALRHGDIVGSASTWTRHEEAGVPTMASTGLAITTSGFSVLKSNATLNYSLNQSEVRYIYMAFK